MVSANRPLNRTFRGTYVRYEIGYPLTSQKSRDVDSFGELDSVADRYPNLKPYDRYRSIEIRIRCRRSTVIISTVDHARWEKPRVMASSYLIPHWYLILVRYAAILSRKYYMASVWNSELLAISRDFVLSLRSSWYWVPLIPSKE
jgi:hypothetical protein